MLVKQRPIWNNSLWWPTTMKDAVEYCRQCDLYQRMGQPNERDGMPHQLVLPLEHFQNWGFNFVMPFKLAIPKTGNRYVIVATDYCPKGIQAKALRDNTMESTAKFLYEYIWCKVECLIDLISNQRNHLITHNLTYQYDNVYKGKTT